MWWRHVSEAILDHEHDLPKVPSRDLSPLLDGNDQPVTFARWYLDWLGLSATELSQDNASSEAPRPPLRPRSQRGAGRGAAEPRASRSARRVSFHLVGRRGAPVHAYADAVFARDAIRGGWSGDVAALGEGEADRDRRLFVERVDRDPGGAGLSQVRVLGHIETDTDAAATVLSPSEDHSSVLAHVVAQQVAQNVAQKVAGRVAERIAQQVAPPRRVVLRGCRSAGVGQRGRAVTPLPPSEEESLSSLREVWRRVGEDPGTPAGLPGSRRGFLLPRPGRARNATPTAPSGHTRISSTFAAPPRSFDGRAAHAPALGR